MLSRRFCREIQSFAEPTVFRLAVTMASFLFYARATRRCRLLARACLIAYHVTPPYFLTLARRAARLLLPDAMLSRRFALLLF